MLQQIRLPAVVLEAHRDLGIVRRDGVFPRPREEPEQDPELEDDVRRGEGEADGHLRQRADDRADTGEERGRAREGDADSGQRQDEDQSAPVLGDDERDVVECAADAPDPDTLTGFDGCPRGHEPGGAVLGCHLLTTFPSRILITMPTISVVPLESRPRTTYAASVSCSSRVAPTNAWFSYVTRGFSCF